MSVKKNIEMSKNYLSGLTKLDTKLLNEATKNGYEIKSLSEMYEIGRLADKLSNIASLPTTDKFEKAEYREKEEVLDEKVLQFINKYLEQNEGTKDLNKLKVMKSFESYINNLIQVEELKDADILKLVSSIKEKLSKLKDVSVNTLTFSDLFVDFKNGEKLQIDKSFRKVFSVSSKPGEMDDEIYLNLRGKNNPLDITIDVTKDQNENGYNFWLYNKDIKSSNKTLNFYLKDNSNGKDYNQIYYSYSKNGKTYLGVVGFKFDSNNGKIYGFKSIEKEISQDKPLTKDELKKYEDKVYDSGIFDSTGYTIEKDTVSTIGSSDFGVDEKLYNQLSKKFKNKTNLKFALIMLYADVFSNKNELNKFNIGGADLSGIGTGDMLGVIIDKKGFDNLKLEEKLSKYYNLVAGLSPYEIGYIQKSIEKFGNISLDKGWTKEMIGFLADFNDSGVVGDMKNTIIGERVVTMLDKLPKNKRSEKIMEIAKFGGATEDVIKLNNPHLIKYFFWKGLTNLNLGPAALEEYLMKDKSLSEITKESLKRKEDFQNKTLEFLLGKEEARKFREKLNKKYEDLKAKLPEDLRNDKTILARLRNSVDYAGFTALYIKGENNDSVGAFGLNYAVDWGIIDNLSLGVISKDGQLTLGIGLGKNFKLYESKDKRTGLSAHFALLDGIIPVASLSGYHNFRDSKLEDWTDSSRTIVASVGTTFPILFGSLEYNFGKAKQIEQKNAKAELFLGKLFDDILKCKNISSCKALDESKYSDVVEKNIVMSVKAMLKAMDMSQFTLQEKQEVYKSIKETILANYSRLNFESNKGTRLSGIGIFLFGLLPIPYAKFESIKVKYSLNKQAAKQVADYVDAAKEGKVGKKETIVGPNSFVDFINARLGKDVVTYDGKNFVIDTTKLPKGSQIVFQNSTKLYKKGDKIYVGGEIGSSLAALNMKVPGKDGILILIGDNSFAKSYVNNSVLIAKYIKKNNSGKLEFEGVEKGDKILPLNFNNAKNVNLNKELDKEYKKLKEESGYKILETSFDGGVLVSSRGRLVGKQYAHLVELAKDYNYDEILKYFRYTMLKRLPGRNYTPLAAYMIYSQKIGQKNLDNLRKFLSDTLENGSIQKKKLVVDRIFRNFVVDEHIKIKEHYSEIKTEVEKILKKLGIKETDKSYILPDSIVKKLGLENGYVEKGDELFLSAKLAKAGYKKEAQIIHEWYTARMPLKQFDTQDWSERAATNRMAGFIRSLRNEVLFPDLRMPTASSLGYALEHSDWFKNLDANTRGEVRLAIAFSGKKGVEHELKMAEGILSNNKPEWFKKLPKDVQERFLTFYDIVKKSNLLINKSGFEKPTYKSVKVNNILAFPYTYKLSVDTEHGHVPMAGVANLVDANGDGKFDANDYEKLTFKGDREYFYSMLSDSFKKSLKNIVKEVYKVNLSDEELKDLFVNKHLTKDGKNISIDYDLVLTKRADCFNTTIAMMNLKVGNNGLQINAVTGDSYLSNVASGSATESMAGYSERRWDKTYNSNNPTNNPNNTQTGGGSSRSATGDINTGNQGDAGNDVP